MRLSVPADYQVVASGSLVRTAVTPPLDGGRGGPQRAVRTSEFVSDRPVRYLACVISRLVPVGRTRVDCARHAGPQSGRDVQPANGEQQPADGAARVRHAAVLRENHRRSAVSGLHADSGGRQPAGRPFAGVLRDLSSAAADVAVLVVGRPGGVRGQLQAPVSWRTKWRISGGARRSAGRTITSNG
jgi:hypothetical protein